MIADDVPARPRPCKHERHHGGNPLPLPDPPLTQPDVHGSCPVTSDARPPDAATMNTSKVALQEPRFATGISPANTTSSSSSGPSRTLLPCYLRARLNGTRQVPNVR